MPRRESSPSVSLLSRIFSGLRSLFCKRYHDAPQRDLVEETDAQICRTPPLHRIDEAEKEAEDEEQKHDVEEEECIPLEEMLDDYRVVSEHIITNEKSPARRTSALNTDSRKENSGDVPSSIAPAEAM
jgi:hypothetical protein